MLGVILPGLPRFLHVQANILDMINNRLSLLVEDDYLSGQFVAIAAKLEQLLPGLNVSAFVAAFPLVSAIIACEPPGFP